MTKTDLHEEYFNWMYGLVFGGGVKQLSYRKLFSYLHSVEFEYILPMDGNRAEDGINLRYRFGDIFGYRQHVIAHLLDNRWCSVLEMMVALAVRCEEHIMEDADYGDRTGQWFWNMIVSLGLGSMNDSRFDEEYVESVVTRFLNRDYEPNGKGGLFTVQHPPRDMRSLDIWYQMAAYLNEVI